MNMVTDEIGRMLGRHNSESDTLAKKDDEVVDDGEAKPGSEEKEAKDESVEEEVEEESEEEEESGEEKMTSEEMIANLRGQIGVLRGKLDTKDDEPEIEPELELPILEATDIISEEDLETITQDPKKLNEALHKAATHGHDKAIEHMMRVLPLMVTQEVTRVANIQGLVDKFYRVNKDLRSNKGFVGFVYQEMKGENPGASDAEIFKVLGGETRKRLGAKMQEGTRRQKTSLPGGTGSRAGGVKVDKVDDEIARMEKL